MRLPSILLALLAATPAFARIGDTIEEAQKRYGEPYGNKPSGEYAEARYFTKTYHVSLLFVNGKCVKVNICKYGRKETNPNLTIDREEALGILEKQSNGKVWEQLRRVNEKDESTETKDGLLRAYYANSNEITVVSKELNDYLNKKKVKGVEEEL